MTPIAAGFGGLIGGFMTYAALAGMGGGVDWEDRLTLDQSGELELEGIGLLVGLVAAVLIGTPLGSYIALRIAGAPRAGRMALIAIVPVAVVALAAMWTLPAAPDDPLVVPFVIFGSWFAIPAIVTAAVGRIRRSSTWETPPSG